MFHGSVIVLVFFFVNIGNSIGRGLEWSLKDQMNIESFGLCACSKNLSTLHDPIDSLQDELFRLIGYDHEPNRHANFYSGN
ncbi:hypothetical protein IGI04_001084 [Brassica rapa subsp. trilocularis]|uniref:Uncharacterized protein n=1 Tax=Brassica rapa subsp. trilocularis TaxID=1813537 RepID=A0ABQ7NRM6_BRACM|nr:hypothetical protein IGI04_001084 [Brassica rapa subsp. trilocularis]